MMIKEYNIYFVMEFDPWKFEKDLGVLEGEDFNEQALEVLYRNGIKNIKELDDYAYLSINISAIEEVDLEKFIQVLWKDKWKSTTEKVSTLFGGMVIENLKDKQQTIHHQCCGEILDYQYYLSVLEDKNPDWKQIWIGHPWIFGKVKDDRLYLTSLLQCNKEEVDQLEELTIYEFDLRLFQQKMNKALEKLKAFEKKIATILKKKQLVFSKEIADILVNGH